MPVEGIKMAISIFGLNALKWKFAGAKDQGTIKSLESIYVFESGRWF